MRSPSSLTLLLLLATATCARGVVTYPCGDGLLQHEEGCDDGNRINGDGCDESCQLECGNGRPDAGETCDDGNRLNGDGCDEGCQLECGNGTLDGGEECEYTLTEHCTWDCRWDDSTDGDGDVDGDGDGDGDCADPDIEVPDPGRSLTVRGELTGASDTWQRPIGACTQLSTTTESAPREGYVLVNALDRAATLTIDVLAAGSESGTLADTLLFVYDGASVPGDALGCLASDDDGGEGLDSRIEELVLASGQCVYVVVSAFANIDNERALGTYELEVTTQ